MQNRVATNYAVTREQKRFIAKLAMKKDGIKNACRHTYTTQRNNRGFLSITYNPSYFSQHWREYAQRGTN